MTMRRLLHATTALSIALTGMTVTFSSPGWAQVDELIVTVRRREESLQDIPLSVTAFNADFIERAGVRDIADIAKLTPGLVFDTGFNAQDTRPSIRGVASTRGRPPVGILLDGVDLSSEALQTAGGSNLLNLRLVDIERIEVVKGPQSALYGRVAFAGAINYITREPSDEWEANALVDVGNYGQFEARGSVSGPIVEDILSFRLNGAHAEHNGYYENTVTGGDLGGYNSDGVALTLKFTPNEDWTIRTRVQYTDDEAEPRPEITYGGGNGTAVIEPAPASAAFLGAGASNPPFGITLGLPAKLTLSADPRTNEDYPGSSLESFIANLSVEWDLGFATLTSLSGFTDAESTVFVDSDRFGIEPIPYTAGSLPAGLAVGTPVEPNGIQSELDFETDIVQYSQELRLSTLDSDDRIRWAVGGLFWAEYVKQSDRSINTVIFGGAIPPGFVSWGANTLLIEQPGRPNFSTRPLGRDTTHWSVYGHVDFDILENLTLGLEARYSWEDYEYLLSDTSLTFGVVIPFFATDPVPQENIFTTTADADANFFTPRVSLDWQATEDVLFYASAAKGVKPAGVSTLNFARDLGVEFVTYDTEKIWSYEVGAKTSWFENRFQFNVAGFYQDWSNIQDTQQAIIVVNGISTFQTIVTNERSARIWGAEVDAVWAPVEGLALSGAYTYLNSKYTDFDFVTSSINDVTRGGNCVAQDLRPPAGPDSCLVDLGGNLVERTPKHSFVGLASYRAPLFNTGFDWLVEAAWQWQDDRFLSKWNRWTLDSYWNVDARIGVESDTWSAILYAENLFDNDTVKDAQENFDPYTFGTAIHVTAPAPSQFGVRLGLKL